MVYGECQEAEHQMAHDLFVSRDPHRLAAEVVLGPTVDPFGGAAFVVADILDQSVSGPPPGLCLGYDVLLAPGCARVDVDDGDVP